MKAYCLILFLLVSCGKEVIVEDEVIIGQTDPEFQQLKDDYYSYGKKYNSKLLDSYLVFEVVTIKDAAAVCNLGSRKIIVDKDIWVKLPVYKQKVLVFHELTHCARQIERHNEKQMSIMNGNWNTYTEAEYYENEEMLIKELFFI